MLRRPHVTGVGEAERVEQIEREEFARGHIAPGERPVDPRPAATIVLAREAKEGLAASGQPSAFEVLLLRRPDTARFAAGAYVFPGGVIDEADGDVALVRALAPHHAAVERPALVAALRELFEETGMLPADQPAAGARRDAAAVQRARARLLAGEIDFAGVVRELDFTFHRLEAVYFSRWITPRQLTRRYDTRFFLAMGTGEDPDLTEEHTAHTWATPGAALEGLRAGRFPMLYPTWKTLEALAGFDTFEHALESLGKRKVEPVLAKLQVQGDRLLPLMPGDAGYEVAP